MGVAYRPLTLDTTAAEQLRDVPPVRYEDTITQYAIGW